MVGYTIIEAFNIMNEIPVVHTKYNESDFLPAPGIPSSQTEEYYIKSNLQTFSQSFDSNGDIPYYADIEIYYQNFLVLNLLTKLGGALTLALTVYTFLFGSMQISPWGKIHQFRFSPFYFMTRNKIHEEFNIIPLIKNDLLKNSSNISQELQINIMQDKINNLEKFLRDYIINIEMLENIDQDKIVV
ncbi:21416_t:CDS:2 [Gigaspora margarita]|uniref:21416_t:CDS:1 n=1 Tax=Gigaspora margarita TaxID=4874 RepID=A0ABN7UJJ8_GIGMA|nr:21416_t:CDS:2 [Gigaspora margarita]